MKYYHVVREVDASNDSEVEIARFTSTNPFGKTAMVNFEVIVKRHCPNAVLVKDTTIAGAHWEDSGSFKYYELR